MKSQTKKYNYQTSGVHSLQPFSVVLSQDIKVIVEPNKVLYETIEPEIKYLVADIMRECDVSIDYVSIEEVRAVVLFALERVGKAYKLNIACDVDIAHKLGLYVFRILEQYNLERFDASFAKPDNWYIVDDTCNSCAIEAYQALVYKTLDKNSILKKNSKKFIKTLGQKVYDECISKITTN